MKVSSISIPNCCAAPCILQKGSNVSVTIEFTADKTYDKMSQKLCGEVAPDFCATLGTLPTDFCKYATCPIEAGKMYSVKVQLPILSNYPNVSSRLFKIRQIPQ